MKQQVISSESIPLLWWFIRLRWIACAISLVLTFVSTRILHYLDESRFGSLFLVITVLALSNAIYTVVLRRGWFLDHLSTVQILVDLLILTLMLHLSGGIENPLSFLFLFHVILSGILLGKKQAYLVAGLSFLLYSSLGLAELSGVLPHYTLSVFPHASIEEHEELPSAHDTEGDDPEGHDDDVIHASHNTLYVLSMSGFNFFLILLTAYFITNIMDKLRAEANRTREQRQQLEHVLRATGAGLLILDTDLKPVWNNDSVEQWMSFFSDAERTEEMMKWIEGSEGPAALTLQDGQIRSVERERIDPSGGKQTFQFTVAPLTGPEGEVIQIAELIQDVTERKMVEAEMFHAARMVTLGSLTAGIAHEVGNPLASISARLSLLESEHDEAFFSQSIEVLKREIHRIGRILQGISQVGRPTKDRWGLINVNEIILETVEVLKYHDGARGCEIKTELSPELKHSFGVRDQLAQVFLNLGLNSLDAMESAGKLTIKTYVERGRLVIEFKDTGIGIDAADADRILEPFVSSKKKGSGLGLFVANHILQAHTGTIQFESSPEGGTTFTITLPVHMPHSADTGKEPGK